MIVIAFVCDGLDGRIARASRTSSQFGVEYDSLFDVVAFGVAPAMLTYAWALKPIDVAWGQIGVSGIAFCCAVWRCACPASTYRPRRRTRAVSSACRSAGAAAQRVSPGSALAYSYFEFDSPLTLCTFMVPHHACTRRPDDSRVPDPNFKTVKLEKLA